MCLFGKRRCRYFVLFHHAFLSLVVWLQSTMKVFRVSPSSVHEVALFLWLWWACRYRRCFNHCLQERKIARKNDLEAYILGMRSGDPGTFAVSIFFNAQNSLTALCFIWVRMPTYLKRLLVVLHADREPTYIPELSTERGPTKNAASISMWKQYETVWNCQAVAKMSWQHQPVNRWVILSC